ncbi:SRPBCC domain-containing protein [Pedococcus sp. KACC 23699]|uniref:SRPBCC domain-containing protein n=1 Tax=Pedococcus sp. KACC 23699 TaxID=3149228 RepID=A0AAU7JQ58_9MICO
MELSHSFTVPASVDTTWDTFMDLQEVGSCFPGAQVTEVTDDGFSGTVKVKLGPIALVYSGTGSFIERDDTAHRAVIEAKGKDKRGNGTAGATVTIQLSDAGDGQTKADVQTDLNVTGKPAQFGRGVMQDVSDKLLGQFVACIEGKVGAPAEPAVSGEPAGAVAGAAISTASTAPPGVGGPAPVSVTPAAARTPTPTREPEALDLGTAVLPVVLKSYAKQIVAAVVVLLVGIGLLRRRRKG